MLNDSINKIKLKYSPEIIKIDEKNHISISEYEKRGNTYFEVSFNNNGNEVCIGVYPKEYNKINAQYNSGKILVYMDEYIPEKRTKCVTKVFDLYDILDNTFYSLTEEEALNLFKDGMDTSYLKNKDKLIVRNDIEKKRKFK